MSVTEVLHELPSWKPQDRQALVRRVMELDDQGLTAEDYNRGKPFPDPFLTAAARLGLAPETCLVFEDTATGTEAARAAGMAWVLV